MNTEKINPSIATTEQAVAAYPETWHAKEGDGPYVVTSARTFANNMSPAYNQYGEDLDATTKKERARQNVNEFLESAGLRPGNTMIMLPQQEYPPKLGILDVDAVFSPTGGGEATVAPERADMLITRNPDTVVACRPADCPVLTIEGVDREGKPVLAMVHVGWQGLNAGYLEQAITHLADREEISKESLRIQMSGAGYAESFAMSNEHNPHEGTLKTANRGEYVTHEQSAELFVNMRQNDANGKYEFNVDMPGFIREQLKRSGVEPTQLFEEGSDTTAAESGYSSHKRDAKRGESEVLDGDAVRKYNRFNTRDMVASTMGRPDTEAIMEYHRAGSIKLAEKALAVVDAGVRLGERK